MQYDSTAVPERYRRSRALTSADLERWVHLVQEVLPQAGRSMVIDLGCGTGRFTEALAEELRVTVVGVDPSQRMLQEAPQHNPSRRIFYREGSAEAIPVGENVAALIFMSNALHHVTNIDQALMEMRRVLHPDGIVFIRNYSLENLPFLPYLQFFPEAMQVSRQVLWPRRTMAEHFTNRGFTLLSHGTVRQQASTSVASYMEKIESRVYSDLALISDKAFTRGIWRMREAERSLGGGPVLEQVDYFVFQNARSITSAFT